MVLKNKKVIFFLIILVSFFLRFYKLGQLPFNLHEDEVLSGYVGRYILQNGIDIYGNSWPLLYFNKFGDYYIILPMYFSGLATFLFGINEFAVRFPAAFFGSLIVIPVYFFTKWLYQNVRIALLASFFVAVAPWHVVLSRSSVEGIIGTTLMMWGITSLLNFIENKRFLHFGLSILLFLLTYFIYHPFRLYIPFITSIILIIFWSNIKKNRLILAFLILTNALFIILTIYIATTPWGKGRFIQTSIFSELSGVSIRLNEEIFNSKSNIFLTRLFHNKVIAYGREFIFQYFSYFSPNFLFIKGDTNSRYDVPGQGLFFLSFLVMFLAIFLPSNHSIRINIKPQKLILIILFFLIAPIPAAFTYFGSPNVHRSVFMSVLFPAIFCIGAYKIYFLSYKYKHIIHFFLLLFFVLELIFFWHQYSAQSDLYTSSSRNDGQRELALFLQSEKSRYNAVYVPAEGTMVLYYFFFTNDFDKKYSAKFQIDAYLKNIDNIFFVQHPCPLNYLNENIHTIDSNILVVNRHNCPNQNLPTNYEKVKEIRGINPLLPFRIYRKTSNKD